MYSSSYIVQTFLSLLLFHVQHIATAKDDLGLIRLRAQKRTSADSQLPETLFLWENHLTPEEISNKDLAPTSGDILMDESGSMREQNQQLWFQQDPVKLLLTDCTTTGTTEHSDQSSLLPSAKFQRRQFQDPNACAVPGNNQPDQLKLQQGEQGQEGRRGPTMPDNTRPDEGQAGEAKLGDALTPKVEHYPSSLELSNLFQFGRKGDPQEICNALVGQGTPMCAPIQIPPLVSPAEVVVPGRFWTKFDSCIKVIEELWCCSLVREPVPDRIIDDNQPWSPPNRFQRAPTAYPAAGWSCSRVEDVRGFRNP